MLLRTCSANFLAYGSWYYLYEVACPLDCRPTYLLLLLWHKDTDFSSSLWFFTQFFLFALIHDTTFTGWFALLGEGLAFF